VLAWSTAAVSTMVAILSLTTSPHGSSSRAVASRADAPTAATIGAGAPTAPTTAARASALLADPAASRYSATPEDLGSDPAFTSSVVVLPGRVFVDARSVAVMPFGVEAASSPIHASPRVRAVASDLYADVVQRLESISGIYVAQPISVMPYAGTDIGTEEIASQLGVRGIVQGRVAAAAGRVRVTLSLTDAASDDVMWQGTIERPADAVADIGVDMAADVAAALANASAPAFGQTNYRQDPF
jgi:TolB-like protein